jgi:hypothetical protein
VKLVMAPPTDPVGGYLRFSPPFHPVADHPKSAWIENCPEVVGLARLQAATSPAAHAAQVVQGSRRNEFERFNGGYERASVPSVYVHWLRREGGDE